MKKLIVFPVMLFATLLIAQTNKLDSTGKVGIGTTNPSTLLHVFGYDASNWITTLNNNGTSGHNAYFGYNDGSTTTYGLYITGGRGISTQLDLAVDGKFYVVGNGNIGIGSSTPAYKLDVQGTVSAGTSAGGGIMRLEGKGGYSYPWQIKTTSLGGIDFASDNGTGRVVFLDDGKVGIGTITPGYRLDVQGTLSAGTTAGGGVIRLEGKSGLSQPWQMKTSVLGGIQFLADNGIGEVTFLDNGNVAIGTPPITSAQKLNVDGNIATKKLIVTQLIWSDYVFADNYKLRSLHSLETFIKQNKRLPDVLSAKEVEEKGISVGDNQALLLKKIEELTLYVIAQQKQIDEFKKRIKI